MASLEHNNPAGAKPPVPAAASADERLRKVGVVTQIMRRPELGAVAGLILVMVFSL